MADRERVVRALDCLSRNAQDGTCGGCAYFRPFSDDPDTGWCDRKVAMADALALLREQEPRELTKEEWEQWKKNERRDPICIVWYRDTTPFWVLKPESVNELLYLMGKIKLFTKKPSKEQVKWDD